MIGQGLGHESLTRARGRRGDLQASVPADSCGQIEIDDEEVLAEGRCPGEQGAVGCHDQGIAVEDELVLPTRHVDVGEGSTELACAPLAELQARVVLVALVRRAVDDDEQSAPACLGDRTPLLPQVLADRERDVHATDVEHAGLLTRDEVAELVEDPVVGQMVLVIAGHDATVLQHRRGIDRCPARAAEAIRCALDPIQVANDDDDLTETVVDEAARQLVDRDARCLLEGRSQCQVLDGVARDEHFWQRHHLGTGRGRLADRGVGSLGVAREVSHRWVALDQGQSQRGHRGSVGVRNAPETRARAHWGHG